MKQLRKFTHTLITYLYKWDEEFRKSQYEKEKQALMELAQKNAKRDMLERKFIQVIVVDQEGKVVDQTNTYGPTDWILSQLRPRAYSKHKCIPEGYKLVNMNGEGG